MLAYPIRLNKDDNGTYLVTCPDFPEVTTFGNTRNKALEYARHAIEEAVEARIADREEIPTPSNGRCKVALSTQATLTVFLSNIMLNKNVNKSQLARKLRWHRPQVDRLLNIRHETRLDQIDAAFRALETRVKVSIEA